MALAPYDLETMVKKVPTVWQERGLHWHCYQWRGPAAQWGDDTARHSESSDVTPSIVRDWLKKPARLIRATCVVPEDAVKWLRSQWEPTVREALNPVPDWVNSEFKMELALYDLRVGNDISWALWVKGPSVVSMGVVATDAPCH